MNAMQQFKMQSGKDISDTRRLRCESPSGWAIGRSTRASTAPPAPDARGRRPGCGYRRRIDVADGRPGTERPDAGTFSARSRRRRTSWHRRRAYQRERPEAASGFGSVRMDAIWRRRLAGSAGNRDDRRAVQQVRPGIHGLASQAEGDRELGDPRSVGGRLARSETLRREAKPFRGPIQGVGHAHVQVVAHDHRLEFTPPRRARPVRRPPRRPTVRSSIPSRERSVPSEARFNA